MATYVYFRELQRNVCSPRLLLDLYLIVVELRKVLKHFRSTNMQMLHLRYNYSMQSKVMQKL